MSVQQETCRVRLSWNLQRASLQRFDATMSRSRAQHRASRGHAHACSHADGEGVFYIGTPCGTPSVLKVVCSGINDLHIQRAPPGTTRADTRSRAHAQIIQRAALTRLIGDKTALRRTALLERVQLELELQRGLRLLMLCLGMFAGTCAFVVCLRSGARVAGLTKTKQNLCVLAK